MSGTSRPHHRRDQLRRLRRRPRTRDAGAPSGRPSAAGLLTTAALVCGVLVGSDAAPVSAATLTVTTPVDVTAADAELSLREAVAAANATPGDDTIVLAAGSSHTLSDCAAGPLPLTEGATVTIDGNGASIQQTCDAEQLFRIDDGLAGARLELQSIHLVGGPNTAAATIEGVAIHAGTLGVIGLTDVEISGFDAGPGGSVISTGQVHSTSPYGFRMLDSDIHHNTGTAVAGDNTSTWIRSSQIRFNTGGFNAADAWPALIEQSSFTDNVATGFASTGQGLAGQIFTVVDSTFARNGRVGFRCGNCGPVSITGSTVTDNGLTATGDRFGGIDLRIGRPGFGAQLAATITDTVVTGNATNRPDRGGGITILASGAGDVGAAFPVTTVTGSTISGNTTPGHGGGLHLGAGPVTIASTAIFDNTAAGDGGGLWSAVPDGPFDLTLDDVMVQNNTAHGNGGGIAVDDTLAFTLTGSTVSGNSADVRGGGIRAEAASVSVTTSRISANSAVEGGGAHVVSDGLAIRRTTADGNSTVSNGGALFADVAGFAVVEQSTLSANAAGKGGAIAQVGGAFELVHVTSTGNTAVEGADVWQPAAAPLGITNSALVSPGPCLLVGVPVTSRSVVADASCGPDGTSVVSAVAALGPLADNGGPTPTHLPLAGSPLLGRVPLASCTAPVDQRGTARPQGLACEAGSVEVIESAILGSRGADRLIGSAGPDLIRALDGKDLVRAGGGDDDVDGGDGPDTLFGEDGDDLIVGGDGPDTLDGGPGQDRLLGGDGPDVLDGGPGVDVLIGGGGPDVLYVGVGDTADGGPGPDRCWFPGARRAVDC